MLTVLLNHASSLGWNLRYSRCSVNHSRSGVLGSLGRFKLLSSLCCFATLLTKELVVGQDNLLSNWLSWRLFQSRQLGLILFYLMVMDDLF